MAFKILQASTNQRTLFGSRCKLWQFFCRPLGLSMNSLDVTLKSWSQVEPLWWEFITYFLLVWNFFLIDFLGLKRQRLSKEKLVMADLCSNTLAEYGAFPSGSCSHNSLARGRHGGRNYLRGLPACSVTQWIVARQAPLSIGFSKQEYWSGISFPPPGDLPDPGIEPLSPVFPSFAGGFFTSWATKFHSFIL